jgi:hypothetical protein
LRNWFLVFFDTKGTSRRRPGRGADAGYTRRMRACLSLLTRERRRTPSVSARPAHRVSRACFTSSYFSVLPALRSTLRSHCPRLIVSSFALHGCASWRAPGSDASVARERRPVGLLVGLRSRGLLGVRTESGVLFPAGLCLISLRSASVERSRLQRVIALLSYVLEVSNEE